MLCRLDIEIIKFGSRLIAVGRFRRLVVTVATSWRLITRRIIIVVLVFDFIVPCL